VLADMSCIPSSQHPLSDADSQHLQALPFLGVDRPCVGSLQGSLFATDGVSLRRYGFLKSYIRPRPLHLRAYHPVDDQPAAAPDELLDDVIDEWMGEGGVGRDGRTLRRRQKGRTKSPVDGGAENETDVERFLRRIGDLHRKEAQRALDGDGVPPPLLNTLAKSLTAASQRLRPSLPDTATCGRLAVTEYELVAESAAAGRSAGMGAVRRRRARGRRRRTQSDGGAPSGGRYALYHVQLHSHAPHQIRVHFAEAGCPVIGDAYYHPSCSRDIWLANEPSSASAKDDTPSDSRHPVTSLGVQLFHLEVPDPFHPRDSPEGSRRIRVSLAPPPDWAAVDQTLALE